MFTTETVHRLEVPTADRTNHTAKLFGLNFPLRFEPAIYTMAEHLSKDYNGGYWNFYELSNGGFYMAPRADTTFAVSCENGYMGDLSADALGVAACLYAYSHLSFEQGELAEICARHYHLLRDFMLDHVEVSAILGAID